MRSGTYRYVALENVHFGIPASVAISQEVRERGVDRVFVVASRTLNQTTDLVCSALSQIRDKIVGTFDRCEEHTPRETVVELSRQLRETRADLVVSIGGGTVIDTVKVALICLAEGITEQDGLDRCRIQVDAEGTKVVPPLAVPALRQIAVPTTLSAAEFSDLAGCTDRRIGQKHLYTGACIGPVVVILDPQVTLKTPERLWLSSGVRAIDHAVESICSIDSMPLVDASAFRGLGLLCDSLRKYRLNALDLEARLNGQIGAWIASTGVNRVRFGASHGIGHVIGGAFGIPHGITSCVLLPSVLRYNRTVVEDRFRPLAEVLGSPGTDPADLLSDLIEELGLPRRLRDVGVEQRAFAELAVKAMENPWVRANPRRIDEPKQVEEILRLAW